MPRESAGARFDLEFHIRNTVWIAVICAIVGAGIAYAGKAADDRSAFIRWRRQVLEFMQGVNVYDKYYYPNPPIMPLTLYPLMLLPPVAGAMCWFFLKAGMTGASTVWCLRAVRSEAERRAGRMTYLIPGVILLLSFRPILSDLQHGNNNLLIMFLIVAALAFWRSGRDVAAGLALALAICYKVTPGLFLAYFAYKRSWRTVFSTLLGAGLFLLVVPSIFLGPEFNGECLAAWWRRILSPYVSGDVASAQEINQSMVGLVTRLFTEEQASTGRYRVQFDLNLMSLNRELVVGATKALSVAMVALLAYLCRTKTEKRDDPRLFAEFSLVVLTMLLVSERSWKHHFVTMLFPYTYLVYRLFRSDMSRLGKQGIFAALVTSALCMLSTSTEVGGLFADGQGHKIAQFYGLFMWSAVVVYIPVAWLARLERDAGANQSATTPARFRLPRMHAGLASNGVEPAFTKRVGSA